MDELASTTIEKCLEVQDNIESETETINNTDSWLPPEVTLSPRNDEEMDLNLIKDNRKLVLTYIHVSDDKEAFFADNEMVQVSQDFRKRCTNLQNSKIDDLKELLNEGKAIGSQLTQTVNMLENGVAGIFTYRRIENGEFFNDLKEVVKAVHGPVWEKWFETSFGKREFRSIQDYMGLANIPGVKRYSVFGKERLLRTKSQLSPADWETDDPVGAFIKRNGIDFNPENQTDIKELNFETDIATNHQKCINAGLNIPKERIEVLVRNGKEVVKKHLEELKIRKELGQNEVDEFDKILLSGGRVVAPIMTPDRKAEGFKKSTDKFIKEIESAINDEEYLGKFKEEKIAVLRSKLQALEQKLQIIAEKAKIGPSIDNGDLSPNQGGN